MLRTLFGVSAACALSQAQQQQPELAQELDSVGRDGYNQDYTNHSLMFAYTAYQSEYKIKMWSCSYCQYVDGFEVDDIFTTDVLLAYSGYDKTYDQIVFAFRGTIFDQNWLTDGDFVQVEYPGVPGGRVHKGFYKAWEELQSKVLMSADKLMLAHHRSDILITGHSMGAALAQMGALDIFTLANARGFDGKRHVDTFGSPRWGNLAMATYFSSMTDVSWRLVNVHDRVPCVPFHSMLNYTHVGTEVWYMCDEPLMYKVCSGGGEDPACAYSYFVSTWNDHGKYMNIQQIH